MKKRILKSEEKELLIKDLLPRIPTGLFVDVPDEEEPKELGKVVRWRIVYGRARSLEDCLDGLIPYLRPLSSMTKDEQSDFKDRFDGLFQYFNGGIISDSRKYDDKEAVYVSEIECTKLLDWLVSHHFDFRGLIPVGLALEAKEGIYYK